MALLPIVTAPAPILSAKARTVRAEEFGSELEAHLASMAETMYDAPGVGLAAPQVNDGRRILVMDSQKEDGVGLLKMVNPKVTAVSEETQFFNETCLSVPTLEVRVERHQWVTVEYKTPKGKAEEITLEGYEAVIVQHELDHLVGSVLLDRVSRFKKSRYLKLKKKKGF